MAVDHHIDDKDKLIVTTCMGSIEEAELVAALKNYQQTIQNHDDYLDYNEVLIFPETTSVKVSRAGLKKIARMASQTDQLDHTRKLSLLVQSTVGYGLAILYQTYRQLSKSGKQVRVFKKVKPALEWAKIKD